MPTRRGATLADNFLDLVAHRLEGDAQRFERFGRDSFAFVNQPKQDVLGSDVVVVKQPCFFLCKHNNSAGSVCKSFEHEACSCLSSKVRRV